LLARPRRWPRETRTRSKRAGRPNLATGEAGGRGGAPRSHDRGRRDSARDERERCKGAKSRAGKATQDRYGREEGGGRGRGPEPEGRKRGRATKGRKRDPEAARQIFLLRDKTVWHCQKLFGSIYWHCYNEGCLVLFGISACLRPGVLVLGAPFCPACAPFRAERSLPWLLQRRIRIWPPASPVARSALAAATSRARPPKRLSAA